jgi:hypothetical protein
LCTELWSVLCPILFVYWTALSQLQRLMVAWLGVTNWKSFGGTNVLYIHLNMRKYLQKKKKLKSLLRLRGLQSKIRTRYFLTRSTTYNYMAFVEIFA